MELRLESPAINTQGWLRAIFWVHEILVNEAMRAERSAVLQAQPFERTEARTGYANGFNKYFDAATGSDQ